VIAIEALVADTVAIAQTPAPTFEEGERIEWLERRLADAPGRRRRDDAGNLIWEWGEGRPRLLIAAHVDTVFARDVTLDVRREGGRLVGPGVGDNAVAIATALHVTECLLKTTALASGAVAFTVCEEGQGNLRGALAACRELRPIAMIALEGHGLDRVVVDAVGSIRALVRVTGPGGHSWEDSDRPSAIDALFELGIGYTRMRQDGIVVNIGTVTGGSSVNTIASECEMMFEIRSTDESQLDSLTEAIGKVVVPTPLTVEVRTIGRRPGGRLARDAEVLRVVRETRDELGLPNTEDAASTDANAGLACGIPSLALGATLGAAMHTTSEYIEIESLELGYRQLESVMRHLLESASHASETQASQRTG